jgi:hypothetical protein
MIIDKLFLGKSNDDLMAIVSNFKKNESASRLSDDFVMKASEKIVKILLEPFDEFVSSAANEPIIVKELLKAREKNEDAHLNPVAEQGVKKEGAMELEQQGQENPADLLCPEEKLPDAEGNPPKEEQTLGDDHACTF